MIVIMFTHKCSLGCFHLEARVIIVVDTRQDLKGLLDQIFHLYPLSVRTIGLKFYRRFLFHQIE